MGMPDKLGMQFDGSPAVIDVPQAQAYAKATKDDNPLYDSGEVIPPVFGVVPTWDAMLKAMDVIPADYRNAVMHGERDMHFHKPLVPSMRLETRSEAFSWRVGSSGTRYTIRIVSHDHRGDKVLEQYATMFIHGLASGASRGPDKPDHSFPEEARANKVGEHVEHVDKDQTFRYRDASGDRMPIHVDEEAAKKAGLPGIILHGICTMAMTGTAVLAVTGTGDPRRLRRLAVRWSKYVLPDSDLTTIVYSAGRREGRRIFPFEATSRGALVVTHGLAEISE